MYNFMYSRQIFLGLPISLSLAAFAHSANAQMVGYAGYDDPRSEVLQANIGSDISLYRNAIAARRNATSSPGTRQDNTVLSTQEAPSWGGLYSAWGSFDTKHLSGTYSGDSTSLIFGADTLVSDTILVGLIGGYNHSTINVPGGQRIRAKSFSMGPYFSAQISDALNLDGFIAYGKPKYDIDGGQFTGEKLFGNLTLSGNIALETADISPFISVASTRESLPGFTSTAPVSIYAPTKIKGFVTTLGASVSFAAIENNNRTILPQAGIEIDYVRSDDGFGNIATFTAPRISGGVTVISDAGALVLGADVSRTSEGTTTIGANVSYFLQF